VGSDRGCAAAGRRGHTPQLSVIGGGGSPQGGVERETYPRLGVSRNCRRETCRADQQRQRHTAYGIRHTATAYGRRQTATADGRRQRQRQTATALGRPRSLPRVVVPTLARRRSQRGSLGVTPLRETSPVGRVAAGAVGQRGTYHHYATWGTRAVSRSAGGRPPGRGHRSRYAR
jgi:hypothetical protein